MMLGTYYFIRQAQADEVGTGVPAQAGLFEMVQPVACPTKPCPV